MTSEHLDQAARLLASGDPRPPVLSVVARGHALAALAQAHAAYAQSAALDQVVTELRALRAELAGRAPRRGWFHRGPQPAPGRPFLTGEEC